MKYIFLAFKTFIVGIVVFVIVCVIYSFCHINEGFSFEDDSITNEIKEKSFNELCDFAENNLDELIEFSDNYISMLGPENTVGNVIYIEAEGDMQEFRDKLFDNVREGYAFINVDGEKAVIYRSNKGAFSESIVVFEKEDSISAENRKDLLMAKDISSRVFVCSNYNHY